mmetsp:Transcript_4022/g.9097  ORF Transcript_4022/g.9097 Transcript_4022/m.9097 type:complete len:366 (-) Transcript_4022:1304-2401(-)
MPEAAAGSVLDTVSFVGCTWGEGRTRAAHVPPMAESAAGASQKSANSSASQLERTPPTKWCSSAVACVPAESPSSPAAATTSPEPSPADSHALPLAVSPESSCTASKAAPASSPAKAPAPSPANSPTASTALLATSPTASSSSPSTVPPTATPSPSNAPNALASPWAKPPPSPLSVIPISVCCSPLDATSSPPSPTLQEVAAPAPTPVSNPPATPSTPPSAPAAAAAPACADCVLASSQAPTKPSPPATGGLSLAEPHSPKCAFGSSTPSVTTLAYAPIRGSVGGESPLAMDVSSLKSPERRDSSATRAWHSVAMAVMAGTMCSNSLTAAAFSAEAVACALIRSRKRPRWSGSLDMAVSTALSRS